MRSKVKKTVPIPGAACILLLVFFAFPVLCYATSVSPGNRNVSIQGVVSPGMTNGANNADWENNEKLSGAGGIDWYLSWDNNNLFIGRIGGNNNHYSVIYIRSQYSAAAFNLNGLNYDGLSPDCSPIGGVNFSCRFKIGSNEFSNWDGATWSAPAGGLLPQFSTQGNGDHVEIAIPWGVISDGNGKPGDFRIILYQYDPGSPTCVPPSTLPFVYAESPWGDGASNGGPTLGVSDGFPVSAGVMPTGCGSGTQTITRWWGCYPIVGGIGPGTLIRQNADAGPDFGVCDTVAFNMAAATPFGTGTWEFIAKPAGAPDPVFANSNSPGTIVSNITAYGDYVFTWSVDYASCYADIDTIAITSFKVPDPAVAASDLILDCELDSSMLTANDPGTPANGIGGTGIWTLISGTGNIGSDSTFSSPVTGLAYGDNVFLWSVSNGPCPGNDDTLILTRYAMPVANSGNDTTLCEPAILPMSGNDPALQPGASGRWWQLNGQTVITFANPFDFKTNVSNLGIGNYQAIWVMSNSKCPSDTDTVSIGVYITPASDAGEDRSYCNLTSMNLLGSIPQLISSSAAGTWRRITGPAGINFSDSTNFNPLIGGLTPGYFIFTWTVSNGPCPAAVDSVEIENVGFLHPGFTEVIHPTRGNSDGSVTVSVPVSGTTPFLYSMESDPPVTGNQFNNLSAGTYIFYVWESSGCTAKKTVTLGAEDLIPGGFSPNGDNVNDQWVIPVLADVSSLKVSVFNVWGSQVHRWEGPWQPWDGNWNGSPVPAGTYMYIIESESTELPPVMKGSVTILR